MMKRAKNENFGQRVRCAFAVSGFSRREMAEICNITPQAVQRWCDGTAMPSSQHLIHLSNLTGASMEWLMWPHPVDMKSTDFAPNGVHVKNIVRAAMEQIAYEADQ